MARKYEVRPNDYAWNCERCEETVLIARFEEIAKFIEPSAVWRPEFESCFYNNGYGVRQAYIDDINAVRKRRRLAPIMFTETDIMDYGRSLDRQAKAEQRRHARDELTAKTAEQRNKLVDLACAEAAKLPPPHRTYEQFKADREQRQLENAKSLEDARKRTTTLNGINIAAFTKPRELAPEVALKMLSLASDPALRDEILARLEPATALTAAESTEDPELRNVLVRRALEA